MTPDENGSPKSTSSPKRLPDKLIQFWNQPHHSGSTVSFNQSVRSSPKSNGSMLSSNDSSASFDYSPGLVKSLAIDESSMILHDNNISVDSNGSRGGRLDSSSLPRIQRQFLAGPDVTSNHTPPSLSKVLVIPRPQSFHSPKATPSMATPDSSKHGQCKSVPLLTDNSTGHTPPNLSQLIKAWNSPHVSGATVSFSKGTSVASSEASTSHDSRQTLRGRVLFDASMVSSTDESSHDHSDTTSFDHDATDSFDHSRTTDSHDQGSSMDTKLSHGTDTSGNEHSHSSSSRKLGASSASSSSGSIRLQDNHSRTSGTNGLSTSAGSSRTGKLSRSSSGSVSDHSGRSKASTSTERSLSSSNASHKLSRSMSSTERSRSLQSSAYGQTSKITGLSQSADCKDSSRSIDGSEHSRESVGRASKSLTSTVSTPDSLSRRLSNRSSQVSEELPTLKSNSSGSHASLEWTTSGSKPALVDSGHKLSLNTSSISSIPDASTSIVTRIDEASKSSIVSNRMSPVGDAASVSVDMDESSRSHRFQSKTIHNSTSSSMNDEIEMDLSSFAKMQRSYLEGVALAPEPTIQPEPDCNERQSVEERDNHSYAPAPNEPKSPDTPERSVLHSDGSRSSKNRTVASLLVDDNVAAPNLSFLSSKSPDRSKHVTFPDQVNVDVNNLATSACDSNPSTDTSSDPSRYENSSLMMSNSILSSEPSSNADSPLETSMQSTSSRVINQSIDVLSSPMSLGTTRGILKNSSYASPICHTVPLNDSKSSTDDVDCSEPTVNTTSALVSSRVSSSPKRKFAQTSMPDYVSGNVEVRYSNPADEGADLTDANPSAGSRSDPVPIANSETSVDSAYFTPQPGQTTASCQGCPPARDSLNTTNSEHGENEHCLMETGQESFDALNHPFSPETIPPTDDLDLTSIHSEGSDGASTGNRHHLVCLSSENDQKLDSSAFFTVAADENEDSQRESFSFDVGFGKECNGSNDTEHMLANVINAAQQAVSKEHPNASTEWLPQLANFRRSHPVVLAPHPFIPTNRNKDRACVTAIPETSSMSQQQPHGFTKTRPYESEGKPRNGSHEGKDDHLNIVSSDRRIPRRKLESNEASPNSPHRRTLVNDEINESFELSSVSTLDSDKEEGQMHFWIDAFLDFVSPTEDERTVNSDDSASTVSESVAFTRTVSEDVSNNARLFPDASKKASRSKSKKKTVSSFSRLREWWKKELIAEVMRDTAKKAEIEKKSKKQRACPNVEKLVSKEFKKVLSGERIELIGSMDSCDPDIASLKPPLHVERDTLPHDWMESLKKTIVCSTADGLKESYKTIQHEVESFDTLDGLVQALKNSKFETDSAALSGRFKSIYEQLQKGIMEANVFDKKATAASSEPDNEPTTPQSLDVAETAVTNGGALTHEPHGIVSFPPDDSLELFLKEESSQFHASRPPVTPPIATTSTVDSHGRKKPSSRRLFRTPENSLIEHSLNESQSTNADVFGDTGVVDAAKDAATSLRCSSEEVGQEDHQLSIDAWNDSIAPSDHEITMTDFEQRKLCSTSSESLSQSGLSMPHDISWTDSRNLTNGSSSDISIKVSSMPPTPDCQRDSSNGKREFKLSPDKRNLTKDTVPDVSEESVNLTKLDFVQVSRVRDSKPDPELSPVREPGLGRTKRRRSPKIHITTLSQPCTSGVEPCGVGDPFLRNGRPPLDLVETALRTDVSEVNLTQFGEECELPRPDSDHDELSQNFDGHDSRILADSSFTFLDQEFAQATSITATNSTDAAQLELSVQQDVPGTQLRDVPSKDDGQTNPLKARMLQRIGSMPLLKKRLGLKTRRTIASRVDGSRTKLNSDSPLTDEVVEARPDTDIAFSFSDGNLSEVKPESTSGRQDLRSTNRAYEPKETNWTTVDAVSSSKFTVGSLLDVEVPLFPPLMKSGDADLSSSDEIFFRVGVERNRLTGPTRSAVSSQLLKTPDKETYDASLVRDEAKIEDKTASSPDVSFREWEDFSSNEFGFNAFAEKAHTSPSVPNDTPTLSAAFDKQVLSQSSDVYTTSESDFLSFDKNVCASVAM